MYTMEHYDMKKEPITTWTEPEISVRGGTSQTQREKHCICSHTWEKDAVLFSKQILTVTTELHPHMHALLPQFIISMLCEIHIPTPF